MFTRNHLFLLLTLNLFSFSLFGQVSGVNPQLIMYRHNSTPTSPAPVVTGNVLGTLKWNGLTAPNAIRTGATIRSIVEGPVSPGFLQGNMIFSTSGAIGLSDRMVITSTGLVGIGTMDPLYHLHVNGNTHTSGRFYGRIHFDNNQPTDLPNTYNDEAYFERKTRAILGLSANTYAEGGILTLAPTGLALDRQIFSGGTDGLWTRSQDAGGANTWAAWEKLLTSGDINGNVGRVARFTGANPGDPSSTLGNSQLFDDGTRVGIGTLTPDAAYLVTLGGDTRINGNTRTTGNANVDGNATVTGNATINGTSRLVGKVAIGADPVPTVGSHALYVGGSAIAEEVVVKLKVNWPDYVFSANHCLPSLQEVASYIAVEKHLPGVPSANEIAQFGLAVGDMQKIQMEKIEELYLHLIELEKSMNELKSENQSLKNRLEQIERR
ncbi:MAG: hypothetical protein IT269_11940 [Saprospiraceae bacterium]|nr:hypothetical protein [Saprospiraceae bacterium]